MTLYSILPVLRSEGRQDALERERLSYLTLCLRQRDMWQRLWVRQRRELRTLKGKGPSLDAKTKHESQTNGLLQMMWDVQKSGELGKHGQSVFVVQEDYRERKSAAVRLLKVGVIQRWMRRVLRQSKGKRVQNCIRIQAVWRGHHVRTHGDAHAFLVATKDARQRAATKIQALWRGHHVRHVLAGAKYFDEDDFDYAEVDVNTFLPAPHVFDTTFIEINPEIEKKAALLRNRMRHSATGLLLF